MSGGLLRARGQRILSRGASTSHVDHYATLGLESSASAKEVKQAFYELSKQHHPDVSSAADAATKFQQVAEAYEVLGSEDSRRAYDSERSNFRRRSDFYEAGQGRRGGWTGSAPTPPPQGPRRAYGFRYPGTAYDFTGSDYVREDPDSFTNRHRPESQRRSEEAEPSGDFPPGFDRDYARFVEWQRRWRSNQRVAKASPPPPEFWAERSQRQYESFYQGTARPHFQAFGRESFEDSGYEREQERLRLVQDRLEEAARNARIDREIREMHTERQERIESGGGTLKERMAAVATISLALGLLSIAFGAR